MNEGAFYLFFIGLASGAVLTTLASVFVYRTLARPNLEKHFIRRKEQFTSLASHYLLNPITVIQTAVSGLQERDTAMTVDERSVLYEAIVRGQQRLWIIVQQLIVVGELDDNELRLQIGVADIYDVVSTSVAAVDPFARAKKVSVHIENDTNEIREARFDARRLKQAIIAVVDNAVKFSLDEGEVRVKIGFESGIFSIIVEDDGIGMPDEILTHASEEFFRGTSVYTFDYEGFGLGLHIAKAIVRLHQGNLAITSKPKRGTVVSIQFPSL